jgi:site-specific recombinase XerC
LASFYHYCVAEGVVARDPSANVRRPKVDHESRTLGLDRNELGARLVQAGLGTPRDHALVTLLAMNGLRISEALNADVDDLDSEASATPSPLLVRAVPGAHSWMARPCFRSRRLEDATDGLLRRAVGCRLRLRRLGRAF